jgi:hypothetical protein
MMMKRTKGLTKAKLENAPVTPKTPVFPHKGISRAKAVKLHCCGCMGYDGTGAGTSYKEAKRLVRECDTTNCYLWFYRAQSKDNVLPKGGR